MHNEHLLRTLSAPLRSPRGTHPQSFRAPGAISTESESSSKGSSSSCPRPWERRTKDEGKEETQTLSLSFLVFWLKKVL